MKPPKQSTLNGLQKGTGKPTMAISTSKTELFIQRPSQLVMRSVQCPVTGSFFAGVQILQKTPESPFFLAIDHRRKPQDHIWFLNMPMGERKIGQFLSQASKNAEISKSSRITNHLVHKPCIKTLLDSGVSHNTVAQLSGGKNPES